MPGKWNVHMASQNRFDKARSNWRSLYSWVSWFNKALKKVWKPASLMIFLISGDNISHMPSTFKGYRSFWGSAKQSSTHHQEVQNLHAPTNFPCSKITYPTKFPMTIVTYLSNFSMTKNCMPQQNYPWPKIACSQQNYPWPKISYPTKTPQSIAIYTQQSFPWPKSHVK